MTQHTPGPWRAKGYSIWGPTSKETKIGLVANTMASYPASECEANAAFIVRACNAHEELIAELKAARAALYNVPEVGKRYDQQHSDTHIRACLAIDAAIAKAEKGDNSHA